MGSSSSSAVSSSSSSSSGVSSVAQDEVIMEYYQKVVAYHQMDSTKKLLRELRSEGNGCMWSPQSLPIPACYEYAEFQRVSALPIQWKHPKENRLLRPDEYYLFGGVMTVATLPNGWKLVCSTGRWPARWHLAEFQYYSVVDAKGLLMAEGDSDTDGRQCLSCSYVKKDKVLLTDRVVYDSKLEVWKPTPSVERLQLFQYRLHDFETSTNVASYDASLSTWNNSVREEYKQLMDQYESFTDAERKLLGDTCKPELYTVIRDGGRLGGDPTYLYARNAPNRAPLPEIGFYRSCVMPCWNFVELFSDRC